jgi:hypothetical protein
MKNAGRTSMIWIFVTLFIVVIYNNCAFEKGDLRFKDSESLLVSVAGTCDEVLFTRYKTNVYPFFRSSSTCMGCHIEGGQGLGLFASDKVETSFGAFSAAGMTKITYMATNDLHKPPYTGAHNIPVLTDLTSKWNIFQAEYLDCVSRSTNGGVNESLLTSKKAAPAIYSAVNGVETLKWNLDFAQDLDESVTRSIPAEITIDVSVLYQNVAGVSLAKGYIFSNPTLRMKDPAQQVVIEGIFFQINGQPISSQTTFTNVSRVVSGTSAIPLMINSRANTLIEPLSTTDVFQLYVRRIVPTSGTEDAPPPLTPILRASDPRTRSETILSTADATILILRDAGVVRWCLSESPVAPATTEEPCMSGITGTGTSNGWNLSRPTDFTLSAGDGSKTVYLWVADQNLKINTVPAMTTIELDTTAPAVATINSVSISDSQVADLSVSHPQESDVGAWCVFEQNSIDPAPATVTLGDDCWRWTDNGAKPTTVGFKDGGVRNIWVFVRDRAGNISAPSNMRTVTNTFGAITYSQLTSAAGGPRAVMRNRCFTCHGSSSNPGFSKLQLFDYTSALVVAESGVLVSRINNPISPMPNVAGGLMPQRDRDLIRLWTLPEEGDTPLP